MTLYIVLLAEYMPGGSLYDYLHKNRNVLNLSELLKFAIHVCKGMAYLHHNDIIHRDLKTANLLMDTNNVRIKPYSGFTFKMVEFCLFSARMIFWEFNLLQPKQKTYQFNF